LAWIAGDPMAHPVEPGQLLNDSPSMRFRLMHLLAMVRLERRHLNGFGFTLP